MFKLDPNDRIGDRASFLHEQERRTTEYYDMLADRGVSFDWSDCTKAGENGHRSRCEQVKVALCPECQQRNAEAIGAKRAIDDEREALRHQALRQFQREGE